MNDFLDFIESDERYRKGLFIAGLIVVSVVMFWLGFQAGAFHG